MKKICLILGSVFILSIIATLSILYLRSPSTENVQNKSQLTEQEQTDIKKNDNEQTKAKYQLTVEIQEIHEDYFVAVVPQTPNITYKINTKLEDTYCIGDKAVISYDAIQKSDDFTYELTPSSVQQDFSQYRAYKPVIYLYPTKTTKVDVTLNYAGTLLKTIPEYNNGWTVTAEPSGKLTDSQGTEYSYLFWEGEYAADYDMSKGFCVAGKNTKEFLDDKLSFMGLDPKEIDDFEEFWVPHMEDHPYNLISFQTASYTDTAKLTVVPKPDSLLRVFMVFQPMDDYQNIEEQQLKAFTRSGFSVIEWGGAYKESEKQ